MRHKKKGPRSFGGLSSRCAGYVVVDPRGAVSEALGSDGLRPDTAVPSYPTSPLCYGVDANPVRSVRPVIAEGTYPSAPGPDSGKCHAWYRTKFRIIRSILSPLRPDQFRRSTEFVADPVCHRTGPVGRSVTRGEHGDPSPTFSSYSLGISERLVCRPCVPVDRVHRGAGPEIGPNHSWNQTNVWTNHASSRQSVRLPDEGAGSSPPKPNSTTTS